VYHRPWLWLKGLPLQLGAALIVAALRLASLFYPAKSYPVNYKKSKASRAVVRLIKSAYARVLKPVLLRLEELVYRMDTLSYRQRRYRRQNKSQSVPGISTISRTLIYIGLCLHLISNQRRVLVSRKMCRYFYAMHSELAGHTETDKGPPSFDTDSYEIGIDNRASYSMSHRKEDFEGEIKMTQRRIRGIAGTILTKVGYGTLLWKIEDDLGRSHQIRLPNSLYVPEGGVRLLSPQHWAQHAQDNRPSPRGTRCVTYAATLGSTCPGQSPQSKGNTMRHLRGLHRVGVESKTI
jgi:hypothetical protein